MRTTDRPLMTGIAALGIAAGLAIPYKAAAVEHLPSAGLHLSYTFGGRRAFGLGGDLFYSAGNLWECSDRRVAGAYLSATWMNFSYGRFGAGIHGGYAPEIAIGVDAQMGYARTTAHNGMPGWNGFQFGASGVLALFQLGLSGTIPSSASGQRADMTVRLGAALPGVLGPLGCAVEGRPLRGDDGYVLPDVLCRVDPTRGLQPVGLEAGLAEYPSPGGALGAHMEELALRQALVDRRVDDPAFRQAIVDRRVDDPALHQALVRRWLEAGRGEFASIPAFLALADDLARAGAPQSLIARALEAAADELRHASLCFGQAAVLAGVDFVPVMPALPDRPALDRTGTLVRLAVESWEDGCVGEGAAAARAGEAARSGEAAWADTVATRTGAVATRAGAAAVSGRQRAAVSTQRAIARDESRHAALAWDVLEWCLEAGGRPVREAVAALVAGPVVEPEMAAPAERRIDAMLPAWGVPSRGMMESGWARTRREAVARVGTLGVRA